MFERLGSVAYRFRFAIVAAWIAGATAAALLAPSLSSQGTTDQGAFLPAWTESAHARDALQRAFPDETAVGSTTLAFGRTGGLTADDRTYIADTAAWLAGSDAPAVLRDAVTGVETAASRPELASMLRSPDGELELAIVNLSVAGPGGAGDAVIAAIRAHLAATAPSGLQANVTGSAGISSDYLQAIMTGTDRTTAVTIVLVVLILMAIYRAPLAAMVPLVTIGAAFLVARGLLGSLAAAGWQISSLLDTFLVVLVFGVGTDYAIFLISRYREEVSHGDWHAASMATVRRIGAVIAASAGTVVVGLSSMALGQFGMIQTTGPALAIAILVTLAAGLTLTPALLAIFGHYLFWPRHRLTDGDEHDGFFARLASAVSHRPGLVTAVLVVGLVIPALAVPQMKTNFDVLAELPSTSDARLGFDQVADHLGRGKIVQSTAVIDGGPDADLLTPTHLARLRDVGRTLIATPGVASLTSLVSPDGDGRVPDGFVPSIQLRTMADAFTESSRSRETGASPSAVTGSRALGPVADERPRLSGADAAQASATVSLAEADAYLGALGAAYPDVASSTGYSTAATDLAKAEDLLDQARSGALVSTQLRQLIRALTLPTTTGTTGGTSATASAGIVGDYLDELAAAYPEVQDLAVFARTRADAASLTRKIELVTLLDLTTGLEALAGHFDGRTDATLHPTSLAGTDQAIAYRHDLESTFARLGDEIGGLSTALAARTDDIFVPVGLGGTNGDKLDTAVAAFVSGDRTATRLYLTTSDDPYGAAAFATTRRSQDVLAAAAVGFGPAAQAYLGGPTAQLADVQTVLGADFQRVGIITVIGILCVLILLLRAVVAPLYLVGTVLLSCASALGLSSWLFQSVLGQPGVSFYLPILVFVLLVALGSDYNIFLMSRVREESEQRPIHDGIRVAAGRTGAVITSAGLILAGTFGSMASAPLIVLFQVGVAVAIGVLIDTFLVRSILVPAITMLFGARAWWPAGLQGGRWSWRPLVGVLDPTGIGPRRGARLLGALALVVIIPMLFAGLLVASLSNPTGNLRGVRAAVVNLDEPTTVTAPDGSTRTLALGTDLVQRLTADPSADAFTWVATAPVEASRGLADGRYAAVLTVPTDFSTTTAALIGGGQPSTKATLHLDVNEGTNYTVATIARSVGADVAASTAKTVIRGYVDDVLLAVDVAHANLAGAADDADRLTSGASGLADSTGRVSGLTDQLVVGLGELARGTSAAHQGAQQLSAGSHQLASGTTQVANGAAALADGAQAAASGTRKLASAGAALAGGLRTLAASTAELPAQANELAAGAGDVATGSAGVADGSTALAGSLKQLSAGATTLADQSGALSDGAAALARGVGSVADGTSQVAGAAGDVAGGADQLAGAVSSYAAGVAALSANCAALGGTPEICAQLDALAGSGGQLTAAGSDLASGAQQLSTASQRVAGGAADAAQAAATLRSGASQLASGAGRLSDGTVQAAAGAVGLSQAAGQVAEGSAQVATGASTLARSVPGLTGAIAQTAAGAGLLADGTAQAAAGATKLAVGADQLSSGASATASGAAALASGADTAARGAGALASGARDAADGARLVAGDVGRLGSDSQVAASDARHLADQLVTGTASAPATTALTRDRLAGGVSNPVALETTTLNPETTNGNGLAPFFMALALSVGALAIYLVVPAVLDRLGRRRWCIAALAAFGVAALLAAGQAVVMVVALRFGLGVDVARLPELTVLAVLAAVAFVAVNQAILSVVGVRGWLVGLVFVILQLTSAGAPYPIETAPAFFQALHPLLPMTYAVEGFRTLMAGGGLPLAPSVGAIAAWLIAALGLTLAVAHHEAIAGHGRGAAAPLTGGAG